MLAQKVGKKNLLAIDRELNVFWSNEWKNVIENVKKLYDRFSNPDHNDRG